MISLAEVTSLDPLTARPFGYSAELPVVHTAVAVADLTVGDDVMTELINRQLSITGRMGGTPSFELEPGSIDTEHLVDGAVIATKLDTAAVTREAIVNDAVNASKLAQEAVTEAKIATDAITETKISDDAVTTPKIVAGAIVTDHMVAGTIQGDRLAAFSVEATRIASYNLTAQNASFENGIIQTAMIGNAAITDAKIANLSANKITAGTLSANFINGGTLNSVFIFGNAIESGTVTGTTYRSAGTGSSRVEIHSAAADSVRFYVSPAGGGAPILESTVLAGTEGLILNNPDGGYTRAIGGLRITDYLRPYGSDGVVPIGTSTARFSGVWATDGTINTSDITEKRDVTPVAPETALPRVLQVASDATIQYRWNNGMRKHAGFDAAEVGRIHGEDSAAYIDPSVEANERVNPWKGQPPEEWLDQRQEQSIPEDASPEEKAALRPRLREEARQAWARNRAEFDAECEAMRNAPKGIRSHEMLPDLYASIAALTARLSAIEDQR